MTEPRDDLPALDPRAADLLATYRRARAMPPAARARVRDQLVGTGPEGHVLPLRPRRRHDAAWAAALALAAVAILWLARRDSHLSEQTGASATMSPAHGAADPAVNDAALLTPPPAAPQPGLVPAVAPAPTDVVRPRSRPAADRRDAASPSVSADGPDDHRDAHDTAPATDLRGEQALLARGWQALAGGDPGSAARDADEHARRYPAGALAPERRALAAAASCADDPAAGAELARAFLADHPRSPLARRVRDACDLAP
ncbi:hypothetical protein [Nannocystis bainbridge]|uniref:Uncharacterized protein n=1 Tax=Nannocystis bainbridge TaxID=2995303 RepID=A0ABT5E4B4_9BACT|nr:hypothetical protein [Nannocystis bainbridge]MDC0720283.1 hypothetical protein [Nannocystis bainbridge]